MLAQLLPHFEMFVSTLHRYKKKLFLMVCLPCLVFGVYLRFRQPGLDVASLKAMECSQDESSAMIKEICSLHKRDKIVGDMCPAICKEANIVFKRCLNRKEGKHVLLVDCIGSCESGETVPAVLKMSHSQNDKGIHDHMNTINQIIDETFTLIKVFDGNIHFVDYLIDERNLVQKLGEMFYDEYGIKVDKKSDLLRMLMGANHVKFQEMNDDNPAYPIAFVRTVWSLVLQNEYKISKLFNELKIFPKIYGYCGPVYLSEHAPSDERLDRRVKSSEDIVWRKRASTALHILNAVHATDNLPAPLHFCDVKMPHFGLTAGGEIKFIDSDTVFTTEVLYKILKTTPCNKDADCSFFDCLGKCDDNTANCAPHRTNTNLQTVCSSILQDKPGTVFEGVLANPPKAIAKQLQDLLHQCATTSVAIQSGARKNSSSSDWLSKMKLVLVNSLEFV